MLLSFEKAAKALTLSRATLDRIVRRGEIQPIRIGRRVLFTPAALQEFVEKKSHESQTVEHAHD